MKHILRAHREILITQFCKIGLEKIQLEIGTQQIN
jgi:hypothetical protein